MSIELPMPTILEDFEKGDRVWYFGPRDYLKVFGTVEKVMPTYLIMQKDDGGISYIHQEGVSGDPKHLTLPILQKGIDVDSLRVGDKLSKKLTTGRPGSVVRMRCLVEEVVPDVKVVTRYYSRMGAQTVKTYTAGEESIEYQMAGWELEE
jgi:hypothetical protein